MSFEFSFAQLAGDAGHSSAWWQTAIASSITAAAAIAGVWSSNLWSSRQAKKERLATLRNEIYLDVIQGIGSLAFAVGSMANEDFREKDARRAFSRYATAISKMMFVADKKTFDMAQELHQIYIKSYTSAAELRVPITFLYSQISELEAQAKNESQEIDRKFKLLEESSNAALGDREALLLDLDKSLARLKEYRAKAHTLRDEVSIHSLELLKTVAQLATDQAHRYWTLLSCMREEVSLHRISPQVIRDMTGANKDLLSGYMKRMEELMDKNKRSQS